MLSLKNNYCLSPAKGGQVPEPKEELNKSKKPLFILCIQNFFQKTK
jgi:hypothetical protein